MMESYQPASMMAVRRRQGGAASVAIAMLIMLILVAAVLTVQNMSGSSVVDSAKGEEQVAALFLAQSGLEKARSIVANDAAGTGLDSATTGPKLLGTGTLTVGGRTGSFAVKSATFSPSTCGISPPCDSVAIMVEGQIGTASRTLRTVMTSVLTDGVQACAKTFTLTMPVKALGTGSGKVGAFTHLTYRAAQDNTLCPDPGGSTANAVVDTCKIRPPLPDGVDCTLGTFSWELQGTGSNAFSDAGIAANVTAVTAEKYSVTTSLRKIGGGTVVPVNRLIAQTGALYYPKIPNEDVTFIGYYAKDTGSNRTAGANRSSLGVDRDWTCQQGSGTTANKMDLAANADLLVYGFSSTGADKLTAASLGIQPLRRSSQITNILVTDYSQMWHSYNKRYYPQTLAGTTVTGATNGANFTGTIGAQFSGTITGTSNPRTLTLTTNLNANALLTQGDTITDSTGNTVLGTLGMGSGIVSGSIYEITATTAGATASGGMRAYSKVLRVAAAASTGVLTQGDKITLSGGAAIPKTLGGTSYNTLGTKISGTWGAVGSTYNLTGDDQFVISSSLESAGTTITVPGAPNVAPADGTAIAVSSGTGVFGVATVTGSINNGTLTADSCTLMAGEMVFGTNVLGETLITSNAQTCIGGVNGTYTTTCPVNTDPASPNVTCPNQTVASGPMIVRAAIVSSGSASVARGIPSAPGYSISGTTLTVHSATSVTGSLSAGQAIAGSTTLAASNTRIMQQLSGTPGKDGTYEVCQLTDVAGVWTCGSPTTLTTDPLVAGSSAKFYMTSRTPSTRLSNNAVICGGVCAMMFNNTGGRLTESPNLVLTGGNASLDWSSGFACVANVDSASITTFGTIVANQSSWAEVVK
jgi:hypothetical protein